MQLSGGRFKLIIDVPDTIYEGCKQRCAEKKSTIAECLIAKGVPYEERPHGEPVIKCQACRYQVKEWQEDRRRKEKGYWTYGCKHFGELMGYWGFGGNDNEFCSDAEVKETENE